MNSGKDLIDELKKRGFTEKMYFELGNSLIKEYKGHTESYYSNELKGLKEYAEFRKFDNYKFFELKEAE